MSRGGNIHHFAVYLLIAFVIEITIITVWLIWVDSNYTCSIEAIKKHPLIRASPMPQEVIKSLSTLIASFHLENDTRFAFHLTQSDNSIRFEAYIK